MIKSRKPKTSFSSARTSYFDVIIWAATLDGGTTVSRRLLPTAYY
jgi:hypothetical protein